MPATRNGVYHDLSESEYSTSLLGVEYFFSSKKYLDKFTDKVYTNRDIKYKQFCKLGLKYNFNAYSDLLLYKDIEKRGFRVSVKGRELDWQNASASVLVTALKANSKD